MFRPTPTTLCADEGTIKDKIFSSSGNEVSGYTKKGKLFLSFDTNLTENIETMSITGNDLLVSGRHVYNHYRDCRDANYYLSEDRIHDILALPGEKVQHAIWPQFYRSFRLQAFPSGFDLDPDPGLPRSLAEGAPRLLANVQGGVARTTNGPPALLQRWW